MDAEGKAVLLSKMKGVRRGEKRSMLEHLKIPESTYYKWRKVLYQKGIDGFIKKPRKPYRVWNKLLDEEEAEIVKTAVEHTEMSPRLLAIKMTDTGSFSVSEKTVQRVLKKHNLLILRPPSEKPAAKEWRHKTSRPDEIWQMDGTVMFVTDWGYYKYLSVLDDYSRRVMNSELMPDESGFSASDAMELSLEEAKRLGHCLDRHPIVLTDNGSAFKGWVLSDYLENRGMKHIFGRPYHPQTQGKVERFNRTIKDYIYVYAYNSPEELQKAIRQAVEWYNNRPHEALRNVSPNDVYAGRKEEILQRRTAKKKLTVERRKAYNQGKW
ncbi:MAG TPA: integrase core domain-containing protein [Candidatus Goldiibacteriota bacterium]|nr:integrase core domain-containing protein [Candidatus Goldiibacteriota bacterium]